MQVLHRVPGFQWDVYVFATFEALDDFQKVGKDGIA